MSDPGPMFKIAVFVVGMIVLTWIGSMLHYVECWINPLQRSCM